MKKIIHVKTQEECDKVLEKIERDYPNVRWFFGKEKPTTLTSLRYGCYGKDLILQIKNDHLDYFPLEKHIGNKVISAQEFLGEYTFNTDINYPISYKEVNRNLDECVKALKGKRKYNGDKIIEDDDYYYDNHGNIIAEKMLEMNKNIGEILEKLDKDGGSIVFIKDSTKKKYTLIYDELYAIPIEAKSLDNLCRKAIKSNRLNLK